MLPHAALEASAHSKRVSGWPRRQCHASFGGVRVYQLLLFAFVSLIRLRERFPLARLVVCVCGGGILAVVCVKKN